MSFYLWAMRGASVLLFWLAVLIVALSLASNLMVALDASSQPYSPQPGFRLVQFLLAVAMALQNAALPLLGAAVLWRWDHWLLAKKRAEAAE